MGDGRSSGEEALIELLGSIPVHFRKHMGVDVEGGADLRVPQAMLDDFRTDSYGDQCGGIAVAQIVQTDLGRCALSNCLLVTAGSF